VSKLVLACTIVLAIRDEPLATSITPSTVIWVETIKLPIESPALHSERCYPEVI